MISPIINIMALFWMTRRYMLLRRRELCESVPSTLFNLRGESGEVLGAGVVSFVICVNSVCANVLKNCKRFYISKLKSTQNKIQFKRNTFKFPLSISKSND